MIIVLGTILKSLYFIDLHFNKFDLIHNVSFKKKMLVELIKKQTTFKYSFPSISTK